MEDCDKDQETCEAEAIKIANSQVGDSATDDGGRGQMDNESHKFFDPSPEDKGDSMKKELRIDKGKVKDFKYDEDEEVLTADVLITKSQVLPYRGDNGEIIYELLPEKVLQEDSWLESIKTKPVTDTHPSEHVNYENMGQHAKGNLHNNDPWIEQNGKVEVWTKETIYDKNLIKDIRSGTKKQVSVGRFVKTIDESGEYKGVKYDRKQTNMTMNHLAHVKKGRAGLDVEVKLDSGLMSIELTKDEEHSTTQGNSGSGIPIKNAKTNNGVDDIMKLTLGDKELELDVEDEDLQGEVGEFQDEIDERLHEIKDKDEKMDKLEDELDAKEDELDAKEEKLNSKEDEKEDKEKKIGKLEGRIDTLEDKVEDDTTEKVLDEKLALIETVKDVMPNYDWQDKSITEMKTDLIEAVFEDVDLEDKSDGYIDGRFESALEAVENSNRKTVMKTAKKEDSDDEISELKKERLDLYEG